MNPFTNKDFICPICHHAVLDRWLEQDDTDGVYVIQCPECSAKGYGANYPDAYHDLQLQEWLLGFSDALKETNKSFKRIARSLEKLTSQED